MITGNTKVEIFPEEMRAVVILLAMRPLPRCLTSIVLLTERLTVVIRRLHNAKRFIDGDWSHVKGSWICLGYHEVVVLIPVEVQADSFASLCVTAFDGPV